MQGSIPKQAPPPPPLDMMQMSCNPSRKGPYKLTPERSLFCILQYYHSILYSTHGPLKKVLHLSLKKGGREIQRVRRANWEKNLLQCKQARSREIGLKGLLFRGKKRSLKEWESAPSFMCDEYIHAKKGSQPTYEYIHSRVGTLAPAQCFLSQYEYCTVHNAYGHYWQEAYVRCFVCSVSKIWYVTRLYWHST